MHGYTSTDTHTHSITCIQAHTHTHTHTYIHTHAHVHTHTNTHTYIVHTHTHAYIQNTVEASLSLKLYHFACIFEIIESNRLVFYTPINHTDTFIALSWLWLSHSTGNIT